MSTGEVNEERSSAGADDPLGIITLSTRLGERLLKANATITTAESCTGGLIAAALTSISGSSSWFEQGVVTYSNACKTRLLSVPESVFAEHGAVSEACVLAMAAGARHSAGADLAVSVSGIAGPDGGTPDKPVGTVWLAWAYQDAVTARCFQFSGGRDEVRQRAVVSALHGSIELLDK